MERRPGWRCSVLEVEGLVSERSRSLDTVGMARNARFENGGEWSVGEIEDPRRRQGR